MNKRRRCYAYQREPLVRGAVFIVGNAVLNKLTKTIKIGKTIILISINFIRKTNRNLQFRKDFNSCNYFWILFFMMHSKNSKSLINQSRQFLYFQVIQRSLSRLNQDLFFSVFKTRRILKKFSRMILFIEMTQYWFRNFRT